MKWLIWKEYRLQRLVLAVGAFLLVVPYSAPVVAILRDEPHLQLWESAPLFSLLFSVLTLALLGGNAIACERADRSAEFQAYQPISRQQIVLGKLAFPIAAALIVWGVNALVIAFEPWHADILDMLALVAMAASAASCAFGVAWLVSSLQGSPTFAAASGLMAPIAVSALNGLIYWLADLTPGRTVALSFFVLAVIVALSSFTAGTIYYLRRVEP